MFCAEGRSDRGKVRQTNEDSFVVRSTAAGAAALCVVADGMGGCNAGEVASRMATEVIERGAMSWLEAALAGDRPAATLVEDAPEALASAVLAANRQVYEASRHDSELSGMGTTVTAALFAGGHLSLAHIGDSRAFLIRDGAATQITADHSVVAELLRNGSLTEQEAERHPHRNILTRALGTDPVVAVDLWQEELHAGDVVVLCSDGVTRHIGRADLSRLTAAASAPGPVAGAIVDLANTRGGSDNLTAVVIIVGCSQP